MQKFFAVFAIDGSTSNVHFEVADKDTIDIRIVYDASNKAAPIKATVKRYKEDQQPKIMAETNVCNTYNDISEIVQVNRLEAISCKKKE
jgi:undecaprenyl pyrophosphate synthase